MKRERGTSKRISEEVVQRNLMMNNIFENLVFNQTG